MRPSTTCNEGGGEEVEGEWKQKGPFNNLNVRHFPVFDW